MCAIAGTEHTKQLLYKHSGCSQKCYENRGYNGSLD